MTAAPFHSVTVYLNGIHRQSHSRIRTLEDARQIAQLESIALFRNGKCVLLDFDPRCETQRLIGLKEKEAA